MLLERRPDGQTPASSGASGQLDRRREPVLGLRFPRGLSPRPAHSIHSRGEQADENLALRLARHRTPALLGRPLQVQCRAWGGALSLSGLEAVRWADDYSSTTTPTTALVPIGAISARRWSRAPSAGAPRHRAAAASRARRGCRSPRPSHPSPVSAPRSRR